MVGKKRRKRAVPLLGSHQKCWVWGKHAVLETLRAARWLPWEVGFDSNLLEEHVQAELLKLAMEHGVQTAEINSQEMTRICGSREHQGLIAKMPPYPYADRETELKGLQARSAVLILAGIQDPFNFGSILRSADLFGFETVFVPAAGQAAVSAHVVRSSVGAVNYLKIVRVDDLADIGRTLLGNGVQLIAATEKGQCRPDQVDLQLATALIIGNEATGIPPDLLQLCGKQVCIPVSGHVDSLNAAVAAGILCYELRRQRGG